MSGVKSRATYLQLTDLRLLQDWGHDVSGMFRGVMPYLVGSSLVRADWRDIDVRLLLDDKAHAKLKRLTDVQRLGVTVSLWGQRVTGLPVDFQVQQRTAANEIHKGPRRPLAMPRDEYAA